MSLHSNSQRIAKNTMLLYFRMLLTMLVSLYTSRVVLNALGVEDYGIYNVVGGVVAMFGILSGSLSAAISRFITFELGKGDIEKLKKIFCTSVNIQVVLIAIIIILMETIGIWFLNAKMVIPPERLQAANWVFQFSVVTFALNLLSVPYSAVIIAHEKMSAFAYISIVDCMLKLIVAFIIAYNPFDRLVYYGLLIMIIGLINRTIYAVYCKNHFEEATYHFMLDKDLMKEMFGFAGWNFIAASSGVLRDHGGNILINIYFGPMVNAARGVAMQVCNAVTSFVSSFMTAVNPQITKCYASGERDYMMRLIFQSTKFSFFIILFIALPILMTTPYLLELWLKQVPDYTVSFVRLTILFVMSETLARSLITAMLATGNIRNYQLVVGSCSSLNFPISWLCLYMGAPPESVFIVAISISVLCEIFRLLMLRKMIGISIKSFLKEVYFKAIIVALISALFPFIVIFYYPVDGFVSFIVIAIVSLLSAIIIAYWVGCTPEDKEVITIQLHNFIKKLCKN